MTNVIVSLFYIFFIFTFSLVFEFYVSGHHPAVIEGFEHVACLACRQPKVPNWGKDQSK